MTVPDNFACYVDQSVNHKNDHTHYLTCINLDFYVFIALVFTHGQEKIFNRETKSPHLVISKTMFNFLISLLKE